MESLTSNPKLENFQPQVREPDRYSMESLTSNPKLENSLG